MTDLRFAQRAYLRVGFPITSIDDGSQQAENFHTVFESSLETTIHDTGGREFRTTVSLKLIYEPTDPENPFRGVPTLSNYHVFEKPQNIVNLLDREVNREDERFPVFNFISTFSGAPYIQAFSERDNKGYLLSQENTLVVRASRINKNLKQWSAKSLECAILYCAFLLAPLVAKDNRTLAMEIKRDYTRAVSEYKLLDTSTKRYIEQDAYLPYPQGSEYGLVNLTIPYYRGRGPGGF